MRIARRSSRCCRFCDRCWSDSATRLECFVAKRTLILVDGLRWINESSASGVSAAVDLNTIPAGVIDRIEILTNGASSLYGSDAIDLPVALAQRLRRVELRSAGPLLVRRSEPDVLTTTGVISNLTGRESGPFFLLSGECER
jgi:iron complex outermembrane receptor protein